MPSDTASTRARSRRPSPRERLLKAADELFYAEGINSVGIDRVIDRADVARASLYSTFGSKDELIRGYLEHRMEISKARLRAAAEAHDDPREALLSVFGVQAATFARPGYQGCAFSREPGRQRRCHRGLPVGRRGAARRGPAQFGGARRRQRPAPQAGPGRAGRRLTTHLDRPVGLPPPAPERVASTS